MFLKIEAQAFEAGDFLNIFLRFWGFWSSFSYKNCSYKKNVLKKWWLLKAPFIIESSRTAFTWLPSAMKQLLKKCYFEFLHAFNFPCTWNKKASFSRQIIATFRLIAYTVNLFVFFISILYEMIKILHEKMLNAIFNDWFHDDTRSLQWALNKWIEVCHISCQVKPSWWYVIELFLAILKKTFTSKNVGPKGNPVTTPSIWM